MERINLFVLIWEYNPKLINRQVFFIRPSSWVSNGSWLLKNVKVIWSGGDHVANTYARASRTAINVTIETIGRFVGTGFK